MDARDDVVEHHCGARRRILQALPIPLSDDTRDHKGIRPKPTELSSAVGLVTPLGQESINDFSLLTVVARPSSFRSRSATRFTSTSGVLVFLASNSCVSEHVVERAFIRLECAVDVAAAVNSAL